MQTVTPKNGHCKTHFDGTPIVPNQVRIQERRGYWKDLNRKPSLRRRRFVAQYAEIFNAVSATFELPGRARAVLLLYVGATIDKDRVKIFDDEACRIMSANGSSDSTKRQLRRWRQSLIDAQARAGVSLMTVKCGDRTYNDDGSFENHPTECDLSDWWRMAEELRANPPENLSDKPSIRAEQWQLAVSRIAKCLNWSKELQTKPSGKPQTEERRQEMERTRLLNSFSRVMGFDGDNTPEARQKLYAWIESHQPNPLRPNPETPPPPHSGAVPQQEEKKGDTLPAPTGDDELPDWVQEQEDLETDIDLEFRFAITGIDFGVEMGAEQGGGAGQNCPAAIPEALEIQEDTKLESALCPETDTPVEPRDEALRLLGCLEGAGASKVALTLLNDQKPEPENCERWVPEVRTGQMKTIFEYWRGIAERNRWSFIVRPMAKDDWLQADDLTWEGADALSKIGTFCIETSPGSYQVWFKLAPADRSRHAELRVRLQKGLGSDKSATGAMRICGSLNYKYPDPPRVRFVWGNPFRQTTAKQLEVYGLLAPPPPPPPLKPQPYTAGRTVSPPAPGPPVCDKERWPFLNRGACAVRAKGAGYEAVLEFVRESNRLRCQPMKTEAECVRIAKDAMNVPVGTYRTK